MNNRRTRRHRRLTDRNRAELAAGVLAPLILDALCGALCRALARAGMSGAEQDRVLDRIAALGTQDEMLRAVAAGTREAILGLTRAA